MDLNSYSEHLLQLRDRWTNVLVKNQFGGALVDAGSNGYFYSDDQQPPFHPNPHFLQWIPFDDCEHSTMLVRPDESPRVYWYKPRDYWYLAADVPEWIPANFEIQEYDDLDALGRDVRQDVGNLVRCAHIGPSIEDREQLSEKLEQSNELESQLEFLRAYKTQFELNSMRASTRRAIRGHVAAEETFRQGGSEFEIHCAYLCASEQHESALPYPNIVGVNSHAATLHYQHYDRERPSTFHSLLIDAGARFNCYHSDITRTYSYNPEDEFAELIDALDTKQQEIIGKVELKKSFVDLHTDAHLAVSNVLNEVGLVSCSAEAAFEQKLSDVFFPHGVGHLLGLQTHDVGGKTLTLAGEVGESPERFPSLRFLRQIENNIVFTVEPGIYFIPVLLDSIANHRDVNWQKVEQLIPFGGVRIEDNVVVLEGKATNLTRPEFARIANRP